MTTDRTNQGIVVIVSAVAMFFITGMLLLMAYQTIVATAPIKALDAVDYVVTEGANNVLVSSRTYSAKNTPTVVMHHAIYSESNPKRRFILEGGSVGETGEFTVLKSVLLPPHLHGRWCSTVSLHWSQPFALRDHHSHSEPLCFEVPKND